MLRKIIRIDEEKCSGCGLCAEACHEGAIAMADGKARLTKENYCDGLGDCLPACPTGAISFEIREAPAYDEAAVLAAKALQGKAERKPEGLTLSPLVPVPGRLSHWPVQIKLVPENAPRFEGADVLIAADCSAYAYGNFHQDFIRERVVLVGCSKLDAVDYSGKLARIFASHDIRSVTLTRMMVPCCGGMAAAVKKAIRESGKDIPLRIVTFSAEGNILSEKAK